VNTSPFIKRLNLAAMAMVMAIVSAACLMLAPQAARAQALGDFTENAIIDHWFRAQVPTLAANLDVSLSTTACSDSSGGTEVTGGSYARVSVARSLANWAGTQAAGSTAASSGTNGLTSNNVAISFPTPTAGWGTVSHFVLWSGANLVLCQALTTAKTINTGDTVSFPIASMTVTIQ